MAAPTALRPDNRLFAALDLPPDLRGRLNAIGVRVASDSGGRAVPPDNLHVTLAFLGNVPVEVWEALREALGGALRGPRIGVGAGRVVARPSAHGARLVAVELVDADDALAAVADRVATACADALPERRVARQPFWPHVTVARFRRPGHVRRSPATEGERVFDITRASLYDSYITPGQPPRYEALLEVRLEGSLAERSTAHGQGPGTRISPPADRAAVREGLDHAHGGS